MPSLLELTDNEALSPLPPVISNNLRVKVEAEQVSLRHVISHKEKLFQEQPPSIHSVIQIDPFYPHVIAWNPQNLHFEVEDTVVVRKLRVCNASARLIYLQCGRFSNDVGRLGASWCCLRRTRFLLAPGIVAVIYVRATPRGYSSISSANISLRLAAAYMRDNVVALYEFIGATTPSQASGAILEFDTIFLGIQFIAIAIEYLFIRNYK